MTMRKAHIKIMRGRDVLLSGELAGDATDDQLFDLEQLINAGPFRCHIESGEATPTAEGLRRWEPDGMYDGVPCTCKETCKDPCKGERGCKCEACDRSYQDYLSSPASIM